MKTLKHIALLGAAGLALGLVLAAPANADGRWHGSDHRYDQRGWRDHDRWSDNRGRHYDRRDTRVYRYYYYPRDYPYRAYGYAPRRYRDWDDDWWGFLRFGLTIPLYVD